MTYREEIYLLNTVKELKKTVDENNKMLKQIIGYINYINSKADSENSDDFGRNVLANLLSECITSKK